MLISLQSENIIKDFFRRSTLNVEGKFFVVSGAKTENCLPLPRYHMEVVPLSSHRAACYSTMRASFRRNEILPSFRAKKIGKIFLFAECVLSISIKLNFSNKRKYGIT